MKLLLPLMLGLFLSNLQAQIFHTDIRGTDDATNGGMFQLATPSANHYLRLFSGRVGDPKPYLYFSDPDTFRIASGVSDFSNFTENMTILNGLGSNGSNTTFLGVANPQPKTELDIKTNSVDDGSEIRISNQDESHFLRFFSGRQNLAYPIIYWKQGDSLSMGTDQNTYSEIFKLRSDGTMFLNSNKGIALNAGDRPLITRGWDKFTSGPHAGIGRWGIFMESNYLTFGMPDIPSRGFQFVSYNPDGTIAQTQMRLKAGKLGINNPDPQYLLDVNGDANITGTIRLNGDPGTTGQVLTSNGANDPTWTTVAGENPQIGFGAKLSGNMSILTYMDSTLETFSELYDDGNNFNAVTGVFTVPSAGLYQFSFQASWNSPGPTYSDIPVIQGIKKNGFYWEEMDQKISINSSYLDDTFRTYNIKLDVGDEVTFYVRQSSGATITLFAIGSIADTKISGFKVY